jgi:hypothetical protein
MENKTSNTMGYSNIFSFSLQFYRKRIIMLKKLKDYAQHQPLRFILFLALLTHLLAAIFSAGYAMHDDHFLIIESSGSWADGYDYNSWLPATQAKQIKAGTQTDFQPQGHSFLYPGAHFLLFKGLQFCGVHNPQVQMYFVRLIHVLLSLWAIYLAFQITLGLSNAKNALQVGVVLALSWSLPFLSVRNLVEMVCIPFLLWGIYLLVKYAARHSMKFFLLAGFTMGIALTIRYQLAVFLAFLGLVLLIQKKWRMFFGVFLGSMVSFCLLQGFLDYLVWGVPFAEFIEYVRYNMGPAKADYAHDLGKTYWFGYIFVLGLMTVPVLGFFWLFGLFAQFKKNAWLIIPIIGFVAFHSYYLNRQERFVFPMVYLVVIVGVMGWNEYQTNSKFWQERPKLWSGISKSAWILNTILLLVLTFTYTKRSRVEAAYFLYKKPVKLVVQENTFNGNLSMLPKFYTDNWQLSTYSISNQTELNTFLEKATTQPDYVFFYGNENLKQRAQVFVQKYPKLHYIKTIEPSFFDNLLYKINPINKNERIVIYGLQN